MKPLRLPKKYLSSSQMDLWIKNPERYKREYFEGARKLRTRYLDFGSRIHKMIEDGSYKDHLPDLPVYPERELRITTKIQGVPTLSYIDGNDPKGMFADYKTGKTPWTQAKLQKSEQMLFYAVMFRATTGKIKKCALHWIETLDEGSIESDFWKDDQKVVLTGRVETFYRTFDKRELDRMEAEIVRVAHEISDAYEAFINEL